MSEFNLCYFNAFVVHESTNAVKRIEPITVSANAKKLFYEFCKIPDGVNRDTRKSFKNEALASYEGLVESAELKELCIFTMNNIDVCVSDPIHDIMVKRAYSLHEQMTVDTSFDTVSALIAQHDKSCHVIPVTNAEQLTNPIMCPFWKSHVHDRTNQDPRGYNNHVKR